MGLDAWPSVPLAEVADLQVGYAFKSRAFSDRPPDPRLLRGDNVSQGKLNWSNVRRWDAASTKGLDRYWLDVGDVILAMDRPWVEAGLKYAVVGPSDLPALLVQRVARLRGGPRLEVGYLRYVIASREFTAYVLSVQTGTTIPHISGAQILGFECPLPPLREQRAIADVLGALDDKIELNRRMSETLEQMARTLFKAWFVDRTDSLPDVVPGEWLDAPLSTIAEVHRDKWDPGAEPDVSVHHFSLPAYDAGRWPIHEPGRAIKSTKTLVPVGCVLLSRLNPRIRRVWLTDVAPTVPAVASTEFLVLTPKPPFGRAFLYLAVSAEDFQGVLVSRATGTSGSHQRVRPASVLDVPVPRPPEDLLAGFEPVAGGLLDRLQICARESQALAALRDALLPKLISGEVRIPDAERVVSEVT